MATRVWNADHSRYTRRAPIGKVQEGAQVVEGKEVLEVVKKVAADAGKIAITFKGKKVEVFHASKTFAVVDDDDEHQKLFDDHYKWMKEVRDPATKRHEPVRVIISHNNVCSAEYEIAELPDGRWAIHVGLHVGAGCGQGHPWHPEATREAAIGRFVLQARTYFFQKYLFQNSCTTHEEKQGIVEMRELLQPTLFGDFIEPDTKTKRKRK